MQGRPLQLGELAAEHLHRHSTKVGNRRCHQGGRGCTGDTALDEAAADKYISSISSINISITRLGGSIKRRIGRIGVRPVGSIGREVDVGGGEELGPELIGIRVGIGQPL